MSAVLNHQARGDLFQQLQEGNTTVHTHFCCQWNFAEAVPSSPGAPVAPLCLQEFFLVFR